MTWLIRFLLFFVLFLVVRSFISKLFKIAPSRGRDTGTRERKPQGLRTVGQAAFKDPQCGIYVDKGLAIPAQSGHETIYFCSERCRDEYLARLRG